MDCIEIALASDGNYFPGLLVTSTSIASSASLKHALSFNILDGGISSENKTFLECKCKEQHPNVTFNWMNVNSHEFDNFPSYGDKGRMAYARLLLPDLLPDCDHVIYSDVDILWREDISKLWELRRDDVLMQSVRDGTPEIEQLEDTWFQEHGYDFNPEKYFCSGMCFFNLTRARQIHLGEKLFDFITSNPDINIVDQTALNVFASNRSDIVMLPEHWQFKTIPGRSVDLSQGIVLHYAADAPWSVLNYIRLLTDFELLWFNTYAKILGVSTWTALRRHYSAFRIISSRLFFLMGTHHLTRGLFKIILAVFGKKDCLNKLQPYLYRVKAALSIDRFTAAQQ